MTGQLRTSAVFAATIVLASPGARDPSIERTWVDTDGLTDAGRALVELISASPDEGLDPQGYGLARLDALARDLESGTVAPEVVDDAYWVSAVAYATDRLEGRVRPRRVQSTWVPETRTFDARGFVERAVADGRFPDALSELDPPYAEFARLREELRWLVRTDDWPQVPDGPTLHPGDAAPAERLVAIAQRIERESGVVIERIGDARYDESLVSAVEEFQDRHGLVPDGIVGTETLRALRATPATLADTISVNLDRWRWMPREIPEREIRVNVAAYQLELLEDGLVQGSMRVIVGRRDWPTPPFRDAVEQVVLNPDWHVPTSIVVREIAPEARVDPDVVLPYAVTTMVDGVERPVDPESIDWDVTDPSAVRLRQPPGSENPLGTIKVMLGNDLGIYLHGTPDTGLFDRLPRTFSHGCVRVEDPLAVASFVTGWTQDALSEAIVTSDTRAIGPRDPIAVTVGYWTARVDADGEVRFAPDPYGYDARMERAWRH